MTGERAVPSNPRRRRRRRSGGAAAWLGAALALMAMAAPAIAAESAYTDLDLAQCVPEPPDPNDPLQSGVWHCTGYAGMPVRVAEGDIRFYVSYGPDAVNEMAAGETLPPFNTIGERLEWRLGDDGAPFATILRYFTDFGDGLPPRQYLVVTRLGPPGSICMIGHVDAVANADANSLARELADTRATGFRCGEDVPSLFGPGTGF